MLLSCAVVEKGEMEGNCGYFKRNLEDNKSPCQMLQLPEVVRRGWYRSGKAVFGGLEDRRIVQSRSWAPRAASAHFKVSLKISKKMEILVFLI